MIKKLFFENIGLKASAVVLAVILWLFVISKGQTEISVNAPIEYTNIPSGIEIAKRGVKSAEVTIKTHESLAKNIKQETVRVFVDVSRAKTGEGVYTLKKDDVTLPFGATVVKVEPSTVKVVFEETVSKKAAIKPSIIGNPEIGYYVKSVEIKPEETIVEGAKSEVRKVGFIKTESVDITGLTEDFRQEVGLEISEGNIRMKNDKVDIHIKILRRGK